MLFRSADWAGLADGTITAAFRRWKRPTVKAGGTLRTAAGMLAIDSVEVVEPSSIDDSWAHRAGRPDAQRVLAELGEHDDERRVYRIEFHYAGSDPRSALRDDTDLDAEELRGIIARLERWDRAAPTPWTRAAMSTIAAHPAVVSTELAALVGTERAVFKSRVRQLKGLGLTESLEVGYRISPRGAVVLDALDDDSGSS